MARSPCICALGVAPCGSPARFRCIDGVFPSDAEIMDSPAPPRIRIRCNETGLEWFAQAVVDFHDRADWSWKLAPESGEAFATLAREGRLRVRPELAARTLDDAKRGDLAVEIRRDALRSPASFADEGDLLAGLIGNLEQAGGWREIVERVDLSARPHFLRHWVLAKFHLGEFEHTVQPILDDLTLDYHWEPMHRGTGEPFIETIDYYMPKYAIIAGLRSSQREHCGQRVTALATRWNKSLRLGFAAAMLDRGNTADWAEDLLRRGESYAGLNSAYKLSGKSRGARIASSITKHLQTQSVFVPFVNHEMANRLKDVLLELDNEADVTWIPNAFTV